MPKYRATCAHSGLSAGEEFTSEDPGWLPLLERGRLVLVDDAAQGSQESTSGAFSGPVDVDPTDDLIGSEIAADESAEESSETGEEDDDADHGIEPDSTASGADLSVE